MASIAVPQVLINEGELNEIVRMIVQSRRGVKIVGNLFGLWRNSLLQPVVQLITGPGKNATLSGKAFSPDPQYHDETKDYLQERHGLLQIGVWCAGSINQYRRLNRACHEFNLKTPVMPTKGKYIVLMFVDCDPGKVAVEYHIINRERIDLSQIGHLKAADVLPGASGFRLLDPVLDKINIGARFRCERDHDTRSFTTDMLQVGGMDARIQPLPAAPQAAQWHEPNAAQLPAPSKRSPPGIQRVAQWYTTDDGTKLLKKIVDHFKNINIPVEMSRDSISHDLTLDVSQCICLHFPPDFPESGMSISWLKDKERFRRNPDEICGVILDRALNAISQETERKSTRL